MYVISVKDKFFRQKFVTQPYPVLAPTLTESLEHAKFWLSYWDCIKWLHLHSEMIMLYDSEIVHLV